MTNDEFDATVFRKGDRIEIRHFYKTEVEDVEYVNIVDRYINGYRPQQITNYISNDKGKKKRNR